MIIPIGDENPTQRTPYVHYTIIAINCLVYLLLNFRSDFDKIVLHYGFTPDHPNVISIFASMFMHADFFHIAGNMLYLWVFGDNVEDTLKHYYLPFYLVGGMAALFLHTVINPGSQTPAIGASGAISAVLGFYMFLFPWHRVKFGYWIWFYVGTFYLESLWAIGFWFVLQSLYGFLFLSISSFGGVAYWAHIGGFAFGSVIAIAWRFQFGRKEIQTAAPRRTDPNLILASYMASGNESEFLQLFHRTTRLYGAARIRPEFHLKAAEISIKRKDYADASRIYLSFLAMYSEHPAAPKIRYYLGELFIHKLNKPAKGLGYLRAMLAEPASADHSLLTQARQELEMLETNFSRITSGKQPNELKGQCLVIRQTAEMINPDKVVFVVAQVTGEPIYDVRHRLAHSIGIVATGITANQAISIADYLQSQNIPVLVLDETQTITMPPAQPVIKAEVQDTGVYIETGVNKQRMSWSDIYLAAGARVLVSKSKLISERQDLPLIIKRAKTKVIWGGSGGVIPASNDEYHSTYQNVTENVFAINLVNNNFSNVYQINSQHTTITGLKGDTEYLTKIKGISLFARELFNVLPEDSLVGGVKLLSDENMSGESWIDLTFQSRKTLDDYTSWLVHIRKYS